jgi:inosine-uridine nucleoside N-ribohydrolase
MNVSKEPVSTRRLPRVPEPGERIPLLIDTDCGCEVDDQFAIALAVHCPDRFDIRGFVATHYHDDPASLEDGPAEIARVLDRCGCAGRWPIRRGGPPLQFGGVPSESEACEFIIDEAMAHTADDPLWIVLLGCCTNTASAFINRPEIADRVVILFHGRTQFWPYKASNFNITGDLKACQRLMRSTAPYVLFDTGTYLRCPADETERRLAPLGRTGRYLHEIRMQSDYARSPKKGFFDLGDIAFLVDPTLCEHEVVEIGTFGEDRIWRWDRTFGEIIRVYQIDRARTFELLFERLGDRRS